MKNRFATYIFTFLLLAMAASPVAAYVIPDFPACSAPRGTVKENYPDGIHGIVGSTATYTGSDTVYSISEDILVQCFCPKDESPGIQSNWWNASKLSVSDIDNLKYNGWNYVPNGTNWGLENTAYIVKNNEYTCKDSGTGGGQVQAAVVETPKVLGLADTGDVILLIGTGITGLSFLFVGFYFYNRFRKK